MKVSVLKYDPTVDHEPYYVDYEVPKTEYMTVLEAMMYIDENIEPLAYDHSCRGRICGRCSVMLNGSPCTACTKSIDDGDNVIEPLKGVPVIRDLVVDKSAMQDRISRISRRHRTTELAMTDMDKPLDSLAYKRIDSAARCARCLVCNAACPVLNSKPGQYIGPAGMVAIAMRHYEPTDEKDRIAEAVEEGMWNCIMCGTCDTVCPALEIEHVQTWTELREEATSRGLTDGSAPILPFSSN
jgi:succinate dehydrogenase/fumarate reductase iron-sulfur protein